MPNPAPPVALTPSATASPCQAGADQTCPQGRVWIIPASPSQLLLTQPPRSACYGGQVPGARGGHSPGDGAVSLQDGGFYARLALGPGSAIGAAMRCGGQRGVWVQAGDPVASATPVTTNAQTLTLCLSLQASLRGPAPSHHDWSPNAGGAAFLGTQDAEHRPMALSLRLDPFYPDALSARAQRDITVPAGVWTRLPLRFAMRIHSGLAQGQDWEVSARLRVEGGRLRFCASEAAPEATAPCGPHMPALR